VRFRGTSFSIVEDSKVLCHLAKPYKSADGKLHQHRISEHSWNRPSENEPFCLTSFTSSAEEVPTTTEEPVPLLRDWVRDLHEIVKATPSLTKIQLDGLDEALSILPHTKISKYESFSFVAPLLVQACKIVPLLRT
jgi:hypothetical protein